MKSHHRQRPVRRAVLAAALLGCLTVPIAGSSMPAFAAEGEGDAAGDSGGSAANESVADSSGVLPGMAIPSQREAAMSMAETAHVYVRRAVAHLGRGDLVSAAADLERCSYENGEAPNIDRAAFLLGEIYLQLGDFERFGALAERVSRWSLQSSYVDWMSDESLTLPPRGVGGGALDRAATVSRIGASRSDTRLAAVAASLLLEVGDSAGAQRWIRAGGLGDAPLGIYLSAIAASLRGESAASWWERLARMEPVTPFDADLIGAAVLQQGTNLDAMPSQSRYAPIALHLRAVRAMERGDRETARALGEQLRFDFPDYRDMRQVELMLGAAELDELAWAEAHERFVRMEAEQSRDMNLLQRLQTSAGFDSLWSAWQNGAPDSDFWLLDLDAMRAQASSIVEASLDLRTRPDDSAMELDESSSYRAQTWSSPLGRLVSPPPVESLREVGAMETQASSTYSELERVQWQIEQARRELARRRAYLEDGLASTQSEIRILENLVRELEGLAGSIDQVLNEVDRVTEAYLEQVLARAARILVETERHQLWIASMEHFYVDPGPDSAIPDAIPPDVPLPDSLLLGDRDFAGALGGRADYLQRTLPERIRRSRDEIWKPGLAEKTAELLAEARRLLTNARRLEELVSDAIVALDSEPTLADLHDRARDLRDTANSLAGAAIELRRETAREALDDVRDELRTHEEAVRYGAATAAYELGMPEDSTDAPALAPHVIANYRREARDRFESFLQDYPESFTRAEVRFRLADVYLVESKERFQQAMVSFLDRQQRGMSVGALPVMEYDAALQMYLGILEEEPQYAHRDAVLYHVGVIMADLGDDRAMGYLEQLIAEYPQSAFRQEAYLRMGDYQFDTRDFEQCVAFYEKAAEGDDRSLKAIALYKVGWAYFNRDRFEEAGDAFRRVLDVYELGSVEVETDLQGEAEDYLVHCLARAGGAPMAAVYFDQIGNRPYEKRIMLGLSQLLHRFSLFAEAIEADRLWLERYPDDSGALGTAQRLIGGLETWNKPGEANQVRLQLAEQFRRGGSWPAANDSLAAEADAFARNSVRHVALYHHHEAREEGDGADEHWARALALYGKLIEEWPDEAENPKFHFYSGEAAYRLDNYPQAFEHFTAAAEADTGSFVADAAWMRVAVANIWYEQSETGDEGGPSGAAPSDSTASRRATGDPALARQFLTVSDEYRAGYPDDSRNADLVWRGGQLAVSHEWPDVAAERFETFIETYPGDERAPMAGALRGDALHREEKYGEAGRAYEVALNLARGAEDDTLATRVEAAIPASFYKEAEQASDAASDPVAHHEAAQLFEIVGQRYPQFEFADLALYRAGLDYLKGEQPERGVAAFEALLQEYPESEYERDSHVQIATTLEKTEQPLRAAHAYERYAEAYPDEDDSADALLRSSDLLEEGGDASAAEATRLRYIDRYPDDYETAMNVLHGLALRDLDQVTPGNSVSQFVPETRDEGSEAASNLGRYLELADAHPDLSDAAILARVEFLRGEEERQRFDRIHLRQPLDRSIAMKNESLEKLVAHYQGCTDRAILPWSRASAYRIGDALVAFGDALQQSERPPELNGDDLAAYDEILEEQAWGFFDQGEEIWAEVLRQSVSAEDDEGGWITRTREGLWPRVSERFVHYAAADYPVIEARKPAAPPVMPAANP